LSRFFVAGALGALTFLTGGGIRTPISGLLFNCKMGDRGRNCGEMNDVWTDIVHHDLCKRSEPRPVFKPIAGLLGIFPVACALFLAALSVSSGCASMHEADQAKQLIRVENQNRSRVRAYVAFETSPAVRVFLGTIDAGQDEEFPLPPALEGNRGLVVFCEKGHAIGRPRPNEQFQTSVFTLPGTSTLVLRVRDPIRYSDYTIFTYE
jgi:hypothetical protein